MEIRLKLAKLKEWGIEHGRPLVIAGPCSAETEEQVMQTAIKLKELNIDIYRAGIWKPRTRPDTFEGVGKRGLHWLKKVKEETGLKVATEVANVKHLEECLKAGIDILWIGSRTTVNPFAVQELAEGLKGQDVTVLIKNPVSPDLDLWIGAIERVYKAGIRRIAAIHRGFSFYEKLAYRNDPEWQIPIELKRIIPNIPLICDPSHICGKRSLLLEVSQQAMDLNFDGLIIETHIKPSEALSDAEQQITPSDLKKLLNKLILRQAGIENREYLDYLKSLRKKIDKVDYELIKLLGERMHIAEDIGSLKKENSITILQPRRWEEIVKNMLQYGEKNNLSNEFILKLFRAIHQESINHQTKIMK
jgi:chorismate mutase